MSDKPKMARKATREKLKAAGIDPALWDRPDLTLEEANRLLREVDEAAELEELRSILRELKHSLADSPDLSLDDARRIADESELDLVRIRCGPPPDVDRNSGVRICPMAHSEGLTEVVGESFYAQALRSIHARLPKHDGIVYAWATLVPEPDNKHDENAVAIYIDDKKVGHLNRDDAEDCQYDLILFRDKEKRLLAVPATVIQGQRGLIGVELYWETGDRPMIDVPVAPEAKVVKSSSGCSVVLAIVGGVASGVWLLA